MDLKIIRNARDLDYGDDLRAGRCHVVAFAEEGFSFFKTWLEFVYGFTVSQGVELCNVINNADETGTIWPKGPLSAIPRRFCREALSGKKDQEALCRVLADALRANTLHSKCPQMIFDFRCAVINEKEISDTLHSLVHDPEFLGFNCEVRLLLD